jgi:hypothetical protein
MFAIHEQVFHERIQNPQYRQTSKRNIFTDYILFSTPQAQNRDRGVGFECRIVMPALNPVS